MRWTFRRSRHGSTVPPEQAPGPRITGDWARLGPAPLAVSPVPPTLTPVRRFPGVAGVEPLLARPVVVRPAEHAGQVEELVTVREPQPPLRHRPRRAERVQPAHSGPREAAGPRMRRETVDVTAPPDAGTPSDMGLEPDVVVEPAPVRVVHVVEPGDSALPLTRAVDDYVGTPHQPVLPHAATVAFERFVDEAAQGVEVGTAAWAASLLGVTPTEEGFSSVIDSIPAGDGPDSDEVVPPTRTLRRATLGQSRRLGLHAPMPEYDPTVEPPPEPDSDRLPGWPAWPMDTPEPPPSPSAIEPPQLGLGAPLRERPSRSTPVGRSTPVDGERGRSVEPALPDVHPPDAQWGPVPGMGVIGPPRPVSAAPTAGAVAATAVESGQPEPMVHAEPDLAAPPVGAESAEPTALAPESDGSADRGETFHGETDRMDSFTVEGQPPSVEPLPVVTPLWVAPPATHDELIPRRPPVPPVSPNSTAPDTGAAPMSTTGDEDAQATGPPASQPTGSTGTGGAVGSVYRAAVGTVPPLPAVSAVDDNRDRASEPPVQSVPQDVAAVFQNYFAVDVGTIVVNRGAEVSHRAHELSARAYAAHGDVYLPVEAGGLDQPTTRALLAHELVHAAQQRALGPALPEPTSPDGQALEDAAVATEQWFLGERAEPLPLVHFPLDRLAGPVAGTSPAAATQLATSLAAAGAAFTQAEPRPMSFPAETESAPAGLVPSAADLLTSTPETTPMMSWSAEPPPPADSPTGLWSGETLSAEPAAQGPPPSSDPGDILARLDRVDAALAALSQPEPVTDPHDPRELADLADRLYGHVRGKLRAELLVDRERAGILTDFR